jgi:hypothetical protein
MALSCVPGESAAVQRAISASADPHDMSRRQRQRDELGELCRSGSLTRAIDLAFEHFADFGRDDDILRLLAFAIEGAAVPERLRDRFAELREPTAARCDTPDVCALNRHMAGAARRPRSVRHRS